MPAGQGNQPFQASGDARVILPLQSMPGPLRTLQREVATLHRHVDQLVQSKPAHDPKIYQHFFDSLDEAILLTDGQGMILAANTAATKLLAEGAAESKFLAGQSLRQLLDQAALHSMNEALRELGEGKLSAMCILSPIQNQGVAHRPAARISVLAASPEDQPLLCWKLERARMRDGAESSTDGQPQSALEEQVAALQSANEAKDQFLAVLSHELRTPLTAVLGAASAMEHEQQLPADARHTAEMIRRNAELEARLIDDLLDLSRVRSGKLRLTCQTTDVHAAMHSALDICQSELNAKQLHVELELGATDHFVIADNARLQQVFWNLIKNAAKFTNSGGHIVLRSENTDRQTIRIQIQDDGRGIEPEMLPRIFDAFQQGNTSTNHGFGGLGLGLAISRMLIDAHEGTLSAASEGTGRGTTFTIELETVPPPPRKTELASVVLPGAPPRRIREILLVEDHHDTAEILRRLLEGREYQVRIADSVRSALQATGEQHFDLLICDIGLPDGNGLELMRALRKIRPIKGVALTGFGRDDDVQKSRDAGFYAHITKPVNFNQLQAVIREAEM